MSNAFLRLVLAATLVMIPSAGWAIDWTQPTPEELSMTAQPEVPGAAAVYLYRQETTRDLSQAASDSNQESQRSNFCSTVQSESPITNPQPEMSPKLNLETLYVRLKVLTPEGIRYGNIVFDEPEPYWSALKVEGRTIQSDGTVVPFSGRVDRRMISKTHDMLHYVTSFQMPEVRVGSILEYRIAVSYPEYLENPPRWFLQQELFVRKADYYYVPHTWMRRPEESNYGYTSSLPDSLKVTYKQAERSYSLQTTNVMPLKDEFPMPWHSIANRVIFHHTCFPTVPEFWNTIGKWWSGDVDRFAAVSRLKPVAAELTAVGDTEQQKADKLYAAVAQLENLSFGHGDTLAANEFKEMKVRDAQEVWTRKQGSAQDLTVLFVGLSRAAGLKAYAMAVADRTADSFDPKDVREQDVNDYVAIVVVDGKEQFFDPGEPFCPPGQLSWKHSFAGGIRQTDGGTTFAQTIGGGYKQSQTLRAAKLQLAKDGAVTGAASLTLLGAPAIAWKQRALLDPAIVNDAIAAELAATLPAGFSVKTAKVTGLTEPVTATGAAPLSVVLELKGAFPVSPAGEIELPGSLFEAGNKQLFTTAKRDGPIDLLYASATQDVVTFTLPAGAKLKSPPADASIPLAESARLAVKHTQQNDAFTTTRILIQGKPFYSIAEYPDLQAFYAKVSAQDRQKVAIVTAP